MSAVGSGVRSPASPVKPGGPATAVAVGSLGFFLISLDILIVNVALSAVRDELIGGTVGQQWVVDGYTLKNRQ